MSMTIKPRPLCLYHNKTSFSPHLLPSDHSSIGHISDACFIRDCLIPSSVSLFFAYERIGVIQLYFFAQHIWLKLSCQVFLQTLCSMLTLDSYQKIKPELTTCKANAFIHVLSSWPILFFLTIFSYQTFILSIKDTSLLHCIIYLIFLLGIWFVSRYWKL